MTEKNEDNQVTLEEFLQNMQKKNKLQYLPSKRDDSQNIDNEQQSNR